MSGFLQKLAKLFSAKPQQLYLVTASVSALNAAYYPLPFSMVVGALMAFNALRVQSATSMKRLVNTLLAAYLPVLIFCLVQSDLAQVNYILFDLSSKYLGMFAGMLMLGTVITRWQSFYLGYELLALLLALLVLMTHVVMPDIGQWWLTHLMSVIPAVAESTDPNVQAALSDLSQTAIGTAMQSAWLLTVLGIYLGRLWLLAAKVRMPAWMKKSTLQNYRMSHIYAVILAVVWMAIHFWEISAAMDVGQVLVSSGILAGISSFVVLYRQTNYVWLIVLLLGTLAMVFLHNGAVVFLALGWADSWIDFRTRCHSKQ